MADQQKLKRNPDDVSFWKQQVEQYQSARCSKLAYCRKHELTYHRFLYWADKFKKRPLTTKPLSAFVPLKLAKTEPARNTVLASIRLGREMTLQIHAHSVIADLVKQFI